MHQSGHSRAHSMQTVQFSSSSAITPRERGGSSGLTSGYCWVTDRLVIVLNVTASPWTRPLPGVPLRSPSSLTGAYPALSLGLTRAHPREIFRCGRISGLTLPPCQVVELAYGDDLSDSRADDRGGKARGRGGSAARRIRGGGPGSARAAHP